MKKSLFEVDLYFETQHGANLPPFWHPKTHLGPSWGVFGASWPLLGSSWKHLGDHLVASWAVLGASWAHLGVSLNVLACLGASWSRLGAVLTIKKNLALQLNGKRAYFRRRLDFELSCCFVLQLPVMKFFDSVCVVSFCLFCVVLFVVSPRIRLVSSCSSCFVLCRLVFSFGLFAFFCPVRLASSSLVLTVSSSSCISACSPVRP